MFKLHTAEGYTIYVERKELSARAWVSIYRKTHQRREISAYSAPLYAHEVRTLAVELARQAADMDKEAQENKR